MDRSMFYYELPKGLIAQKPAKPRDSSRLMSVGRFGDDLRHLLFRDIISLLRDGDLLVLNDSKVIPARLIGVKRGTGASVETLLLRCVEGDCWEAAVRPGRRLQPGTLIDYGQNRELTGRIEERLSGGNRLISFQRSEGRPFMQLLESVGKLPLPHYITEQPEDPSDYQTVYASNPGSAAAPTAGFHFTEKLLDDIKSAGTRTAKATLHVGLGTFRPVKADMIEDHIMHREYYFIPESTADAVRETRERGGRVIAVGTTSCRMLEAAAAGGGTVNAGYGSTDIFIYPGYTFRVIDGLITNFHLPESSLIMLVSAFLGYERTMNLYRTAVEQSYRFYSFGDAMAIL